MRNDRTLLHRLIWLRGRGVIGGGSGAAVTVAGVSPLSLPNAKAGLLRSLIQRGKCTVESGAIKCNNGTLVVPNLVNFDEDNVVLGKYINDTGTEANSSYNFYCDALIPVEAGTAYTMHTSQSIAYLSFLEYDGAGNFVRRKLYGASGAPAGDAITHTMEDNTAFIRWGSNPFVTTRVSYENVSEIDWMLTKGDAAQEFVPYGKVIAVGTPETITVTPGGDTAGAVDLLAVGSVADTQDIISGEVTRRTEAILYDGTQDIGRPYLSSTGALDVGAIVVHAPGMEYSGNVATFDAEAETPINAAIVSMEPVQDLHGYDKPWAGGAGKNLCDVADVTGVASQTQIGTVTLPAGDYVISAYISNSGSAGAGVRITKSDNTTIKSIGHSTSATASRYSGSFTLEEETSCKIFVVGTASGYNADVFNVQVEAGTTLTDYAPYRNECPITGHASVTLHHNGDDTTVAIPATPGTVYGGTLDVVNGTLTVDRVVRSGTDWRTVSKSTTGNGFYGRIYLDGDYLRKSSSDIYKCLGNLMPVASGAAYDWHANVAGTIGSPTQYLHIYVPFSALPEYQDGDNALALFRERYDATAFRFVLPIEPVVYHLTPRQIDAIAGGNVFSSDVGAVSIWVQDAPTTESAAPQALRLTAGDNTLTVTAEVGGVELEAEYMEG